MLAVFQTCLFAVAQQMKHLSNFGNNWVILLNLVHTGNLQFLAIFYNLAANEQGLLPKISKI